MPDEMMLHGNWIGSLGKGGDDAAKARMKADDSRDGEAMAKLEELRAHYAAKDAPGFMAAKMEQRGRAICEEALRTINGERQDQYGNPEDTFTKIAALWTAYLYSNDPIDMRITPAMVADMMCLLKIAREKGGKGKRDNCVDLIGYAAMGASMRGYDK